MVRINTGAPVPAGADAVVMVEDTRLVRAEQGGQLEAEVEILAGVRPGAGDSAVSSAALSNTPLRRHPARGLRHRGGRGGARARGGAGAGRGGAAGRRWGHAGHCRIFWNNITSDPTDIWRAVTPCLPVPGVWQVVVARRPVVTVLSTGNEIQEPGEHLRPGHVRWGGVWPAQGGW